MNFHITRGKHVFIAYRQRIRNIARKMAGYLRRNNIDVWFFPWRVGWGDSVTAEEEKGIINSFAGLIIFTPDFLEGRTATEEYRALAAKKREDPAFKLGTLRVDCEQEVLPPFLKDYLNAKIDSYDDPNFVREAEKVRRGLCGLPLEPEDLFDELYDFAFTEFGFDMMESEALEFVDFWYKEMFQYDFGTFAKVYNYAMIKIFNDCEWNEEHQIYVNHWDLAKDFALEFTKEYSKKFNLNTVKKLHKLMSDTMWEYLEYGEGEYPGLENCEGRLLFMFDCLKMQAQGFTHAQIKTDFTRFKEISRFVEDFFGVIPLPWDFSVVRRFVWDWVEKFRNYNRYQLDKTLKTADIINEQLSQDFWTRELIVQGQSKAVYWGDMIRLRDQLKGFYLGKIIQLAVSLTQVEKMKSTTLFAKLKKIIEFAESQRWNFKEMRKFVLQWFGEFRGLQFNLFKKHYFKGIRAGKPVQISIRYALKEALKELTAQRNLYNWVHS